MSNVQRVFVSSTSEDLRPFRAAVREAIGRQGWLPEMMEDFGAGAGPTVEECVRRVERSDLVVLLVAFRRGWVPTREQGGDGVRSVTALELEAARRRGKPVRILLANDRSWPGYLWDHDQVARDWVARFHADLNQPAEFFDPEQRDPHSGAPLPGDAFRNKIDRLLFSHARWLEEVSAVLADVPAPPGLAVLLSELLTLLGGLVLPGEDLTRAYRLSAPAGWEPLLLSSNPVALLRECVRGLAPAPRQSGGGFPLLGFVSSLLAHITAEKAAALRAWLDRAEAHLGCHEAEREQPRRSPPVPAEPRSCSHLLIQVSPAAYTPDCYHIKAWLTGVARPECLLAGEEAQPLSAVPALLDTLRVEVACRGVPFEGLWIDFFLPRELLCAGVDQWPVRLDYLEESVPVGSEHRLVVRSLDRLCKPLAANALRARWEALARQAGAAPQHVGGDHGGGRALYARLCSSKAVVCAVCAACGPPPEPAPANPGGDTLNALLAAGVPVALWARRRTAGPCPGQDLAALLKGVPVAELPDRVWDLRRQALAEAAEGHPGRHISLLWDDPTRPSPDHDPAQQLRPPQPAG